jgi:hypothetical protein
MSEPARVPQEDPQEEPPVDGSMVPAPTQPRRKVEFYGMNKNIVITGTVLSLIKIFKYSMNAGIYDNLLTDAANYIQTANNRKPFLKNRSKVILNVFLISGLAITYGFLQKYVSDEKSPEWHTLDSLSTIAAIIVEIIVVYNLTQSKSNHDDLYFFPLKFLSSFLTISTLMGHKRGKNPGKSLLALLLIELIFIVNTSKIGNKLGMILVVFLPFLWDNFQKKKGDSRGGNEEDENTYYVGYNIARVLIFLVCIFYFFGGHKATMKLVKKFSEVNLSAFRRR